MVLNIVWSLVFLRRCLVLSPFDYNSENWQIISALSLCCCLYTFDIWSNILLQAIQEFCPFVHRYVQHIDTGQYKYKVSLGYLWQEFPWSKDIPELLACHTYSNTRHPFIMVLSKNHGHSHLLTGVRQWSCHYLFIFDLSLLQLGFKHSIFCMRGERFNPLCQNRSPSTWNV